MTPVTDLTQAMADASNAFREARSFGGTESLRACRHALLALLAVYQTRMLAETKMDRLAQLQLCAAQILNLHGALNPEGNGSAEML